MKNIRLPRPILIGLAMATLFWAQSAHAFTAPSAPQSYVLDEAGVLLQAEKTDLENLLNGWQVQTKNQTAIYLFKSLDGETIENVAVQVFQKWGLGQKGTDNGLLFIAAIDDRQFRLEIGYGLEGNLTDISARRILDENIAPSFKEGKYAEGIKSGLARAFRVINGEKFIPNEPAQNYGNKKGQVNWFYFFWFGLVILNILARVLGKSKSWWAGGVIGGVVGVVIDLFTGWWSVIPILLVLGLIFDYIVSKHPPKSGGGRGGMIWPIFFGGGGRGGLGGSSGGGFGGFDGGSSGGGGSSGSW